MVRFSAVSMVTSCLRLALAHRVPPVRQGASQARSTVSVTGFRSLLQAEIGSGWLVVERTSRAFVTLLLLPVVIGIAVLIAAHALLRWRSSLRGGASARLLPD